MTNEYKTCDSCCRSVQIRDNVRHAYQEYIKLHDEYLAFVRSLPAVDKIMCISSYMMDIELVKTIIRECGEKDNPTRAYLVKMTGELSDLMEVNMHPMTSAESRKLGILIEEKERLCDLLKRAMEHMSGAYGLYRDKDLTSRVYSLIMKKTTHNTPHDTMNTTNNNNNNNMTAAAVEATIVNHRNGTPNRPLTTVMTGQNLEIGMLNQKLEDATDPADRERLMKEITTKKAQREATKKLISQVEAPVVNFISEMANNTIAAPVERDRDPAPRIQPSSVVDVDAAPLPSVKPLRLRSMGIIRMPATFQQTKFPGVVISLLNGHPTMAISTRCNKCDIMICHYFDMNASFPEGLDAKNGRWTPDIRFDPVDSTCDSCKKKK